MTEAMRTPVIVALFLIAAGTLGIACEQRITGRIVAVQMEPLGF